jgi:hypothetical protein
MRILITIKTDNAAFRDNENEVREVVERVLRRMDEGLKEGITRDSYGNTVGQWKVTGK